MIEKIEFNGIKEDSLYLSDNRNLTIAIIIKKINEIIEHLNELEKNNTESLPKNKQ